MKVRDLSESRHSMEVYVDCIAELTDKRSHQVEASCASKYAHPPDAKRTCALRGLSRARTVTGSRRHPVLNQDGRADVSVTRFEMATDEGVR